MASSAFQVRSTAASEIAPLSHVIIERNLPFARPVVVRVYVAGPRKSGRVEDLTSGKVQRVYR